MPIGEDVTLDRKSPGDVGSKPSSLCLPVKSEEDFLDEQAELARAGVYELLGSLLAKAPDQELLDLLSNIDDVDPEQGEIAMGWELMRQASRKTTVEEVKHEHFGLFVGVGRGELVPFGSWYMTGYLMEKPVAVLRGDLKSLGIERNEGVTDSEDHLAALCNAMALLIRSPDEIDYKTQSKFFKDHIEPWAEQFCSDLQSANGAHFYRSVGFFAQSVFKIEKTYFSMQV